VYSCYCTPNCSLQEYDLFLGGCEHSIRNQPGAPGNLVISGDFNSHSPEWGSARLNARGMLSDFATSVGLSVCNVGTRPTFKRANAASVIDVTFERLPSRGRQLVTEWTVLEDTFSTSDRFYIEYHVSPRFPQVTSQQPTGARAPGWSVKKLNPAAAELFFALAGPPRPPSPDALASKHVERFGALLSTTCDASMPPRSVFEARKAVHWWNDDNAALRRAAIAARRTYQRAGRRSGRGARRPNSGLTREHVRTSRKRYAGPRRGAGQSCAGQSTMTPGE